MTGLSTLATPNLTKLETLKSRVAEIRARALKQFQQGASGVQTATALSDSFRAFVIELWLDALQIVAPDMVKKLEKQSAIVAVGGTGRGELAPFSDIDLLFLYAPAVSRDFQLATNHCLRELWDAKLTLGHSVRTVRDSIAMAHADSSFATSLVEMQCLWGSTQLVAKLKRSFERSMIRSRRAVFVDACVFNREEERLKNGGTVQQLEPDIKSSRGGLRDLHLLRWVGFAWYGSPEIDSLQLNGALSREDARKLVDAHEFLMKIRVDMHFTAGQPQERLTRDEQLRIAGERRIVGTPAQSPVERLMQDYFQHSTAIAEIVSRFVSRHRQPPLWRRLLDALFTHRKEGHLLISPTSLTVSSGQMEIICSDLKQVLQLFLTAAANRVTIAPRVLEHIRRAAPGFSRDLNGEHSCLFLEILSQRGKLAATLRSMFETGVLEVVLPEFARVRCLLQFNAYHSYTVDEHTLQAIEMVESFDSDPGSIGAAYREIKLKHLLHLAVLLHDVGKGGVEDHSDAGREIAERVAVRLGLPEPQRELLMFLVHKHLVMADVAFRKDISDLGELTRFSHMVGSPEWLTMLYVLTVADISAVGPDVWNDWKSGLLAEFYDRSMMILSGKHPQFLEEERIHKVREHVLATIIPSTATDDERLSLTCWLDQHLDEFSAHYLTETLIQRIAADLEIIRRLQPGDIVVESLYEPDTDTVEYRIVLDRQHSEGCFHRIAGTLTSQRLEILSAQICTTTDGIVVDVFRVHDDDHDGPVPRDRMDSVGRTIRQALRKEVRVDELFQRSRRFTWRQAKTPISNLPNRVTIDNDSSDRCTILGVFAHDRPGLLYTISRAIYRLELSIELAKIATHLDQVLDVFYVTDKGSQRKLTDESRLALIQLELENTLAEFDLSGHQKFVG